MALALGADQRAVLAQAASAAEQAAVVTALAAILADQAVFFTGAAGCADDAAFRTDLAAFGADRRCAVNAGIAVAADLAAVGAGFSAVGADPDVIGALTAGGADVGKAVGAMITAFLADDFTVGAGIAVAAYDAAVRADLAAVRADPDMILALAAVSADILAVIAGTLAFGAKLGAVLTELALRAVVGGAFKALEAIHTVGAFAALRQALAAVRAMALVVAGTFIAELALLAVFIAQALGAGVTLLTILRTISGDKAGTAVLTGRVVFQMADEAGRAVLIAGIAAAGAEASIAELAERRYAFTGTAVGAMLLVCAVGAAIAVGAPLFKAVVALEASDAEVAGQSQTILAFLAMRALIKCAVIALLAFLTVIRALGAAQAIQTVTAIVEFLHTALAFRADLAGVMAFVALPAGRAPVSTGTLRADTEAFGADSAITSGLARSTVHAMGAKFHSAVRANPALNAVVGAFFTAHTLRAASAIPYAPIAFRAMPAAVVYDALGAGTAFIAVVNAVGTEAAFRAVFRLGKAGTASLAVFPVGNGAVRALEIVHLAQLGADLAGCPAFNAELIFTRAVAAGFAVIAVFKGTLVAQIAIIAPAEFLAVIAQPAVRTEVIVFLTALTASLAVGAGIGRALKAELAVFAPAAAVFASAALLAECFVILAFAAVRAMRTAIDGTLRADIAAANAQIFLVKALLAVAAVMLLPAIVMVGVLAAVIAA